MAVLFERIPDQDREFLESIKSKFQGRLNSTRETIPSYWRIDSETGDFLLYLGKGGVEYRGAKYVFCLGGEEIIPFYMEEFDNRKEEDDKKIIRVFSIPAGMIRYPDGWRNEKDFESKKEKLFQRIVNMMVEREPILKKIRAGFELKIDENWQGDRD